MFKKIGQWLGLIRPELVGVDINATTALAIVFNKTRTQLSIQNFAIAQVPEKLINNDEIVLINELIEVIHAVKTAINAVGKYSVIATPSKFVTTRDVFIPHSTKEKEENLVWNEARKAFPNMYSKLYLDYSITARSPKYKPTHDQFLLFAAHKKPMEPRLHCMKLAGLQARILDVDYLAIERAFSLFNDPYKEKTVAIMQIDSDAITFIVFEKNQRIHSYHHYYSITGLDIAIRQMLFDRNIYNKSPERKKSSSINDEQSKQLMNQLQYTLNTFASDNVASEINELLIAGHCALFEDIEKTIANAVGIKATIINPLQNIIISSTVDKTQVNRFAPICLIACGLALRNIDND